MQVLTRLFSTSFSRFGHQHGKVNVGIFDRVSSVSIQEHPSLKTHRSMPSPCMDNHSLANADVAAASWSQKETRRWYFSCTADLYDSHQNHRAQPFTTTITSTLHQHSLTPPPSHRHRFIKTIIVSSTIHFCFARDNIRPSVPFLFWSGYPNAESNDGTE